MLSPPEVRRLVEEVLASPAAAACLARHLRENLTLRVEYGADHLGAYGLGVTVAWDGEIVAAASVPLQPPF